MYQFDLYPNDETDLEELTAQVSGWKFAQAKGRMQVKLSNSFRAYGVHWYKPGFVERVQEKISKKQRMSPLRLIVLIDDDRDATLFKLFFSDFFQSPYPVVILPKIANPSPFSVMDILSVQDMTAPLDLGDDFSMRVRYRD